MGWCFTRVFHPLFRRMQTMVSMATFESSKIYPKLTARICQERAESEAVVPQFIRVADVCLDNGSATFNGCAVGVEADGQPAKKPWRFVTSSLRLATHLAALKCTHSSRAPRQRTWTRMSAFYQKPLCNLMISSLFPYFTNRHVFSMPCVARSRQPHHQKLVKGHLDVMKSELLPVCTNHWIALSGRAIQLSKPLRIEKQGLLANGTWDEPNIVQSPRS